MDKDRRVKLRSGFIQRKIADSDIVIPIGDNIAQFNGLITLNETAAFLFKLISEGSTVRRLIDALTEKYEIEAAMAGKDVADFILQLEKANMLITSEE